MASPRPSGHGAGLAATLEMMEASMRAQVQAQRSSAEAQVKALEAMGKMPKPGVLFERVGKPDFRARTGRHSSSLGSQPRAKTRAGQKDWRDACHGQPPPCGFGYGGLQLTMPARTPLFVPEAPLELNRATPHTKTRKNPGAGPYSYPEGALVHKPKELRSESSIHLQAFTWPIIRGQDIHAPLFSTVVVFLWLGPMHDTVIQ